MKDRDIQNTLGDADLGYLKEGANDLGRGYSDASVRQHRFQDKTPYELALEDRGEGGDPPMGDPDWQWVDPENTEEGGFIERPGIGWKGDIKRL